MLWLTGDPDADALLSSEPLALLIGMVLDQQIPMERAFKAPCDLKERLGGVLDDELQDHVDEIDERWREHVARSERTAKIGRNDPCPCKSGKK